MAPKLKFEQIRNENRSSFRHGRSTHSYREEISLHFHPEIEIIWIRKGSGYRMTGDYLEPFSQGEMILIPSNVPHCWIYNPESCGSDGKWTCMFVQFPVTLAETGMAFFTEWEYPAHRLVQFQQAMRITSEMAREVGALLQSMDKWDESERLTGLLRMLCRIGQSSELVPIGLQTNACGHITKHMHRMQLISRYVVEHYREKITLPEVAARVSLSPTAFCAFFKAETGKSFHTFLNEYRIDRACNLLRNFPEREISEIAWQCGFSDIPYFNRSFRKRMQMTPGEWKKGKELKIPAAIPPDTGPSVVGSIQPGGQSLRE